MIILFMNINNNENNIISFTNEQIKIEIEYMNPNIIIVFFILK